MFLVISEESVIGLYTSVVDAIGISKPIKSGYKIYEVFPNSEEVNLYKVSKEESFHDMITKTMIENVLNWHE